MGLLAFLFRASRGIVLLSVLAGLTGGVCGVGLIALVQAALARPGGGSTSLALAFLGLCVVAAGSRVVAHASMVHLAQGTVCRLCLALCRRLLAAPLETFEGLDPAGVLAVLTEDIVIVANALGGLPLLGINLPIVIACLAYVGWLSPAVLAAGLVFAAVAIAIQQVLALRALRRLALARAGQDLLVAHFRALIGGFRELKQHSGRRAAFVEAGLETAAVTVRDQTVQGLTIFAVASSWGQIAFFGFLGLLLFVFSGSQALGRDALAGVVLVVLFMMTPLELILAWLPILGRAQVSLRRIEALGLSLEQGPANGALPLDALDTQPEVPEIALEGVTYAYDQDGFAMGPIDLTLRPGEIVFVAGGNGTGKTTLVKLLAGLYTPRTGTIRVNGRPVTPETQEAYRQLFSVVFVDGYLFPTLLGLDRPELDDEAEALLARLALTRHVQVAAGAFSTTDLSQGQRKRLALLTAWLEDRPLIILDEWAANQDTAFRRLFYNELLPEWRRLGKTIVVISHDEAYFPIADRVVRIDAGRLRTRPAQLEPDSHEGTGVEPEPETLLRF
jgi:putative ATP-binding cassette transporter